MRQELGAPNIQVRARLESRYGAEGSTAVKDAQARVTSERLMKNAARRELRDSLRHTQKVLQREKALSEARYKREQGSLALCHELKEKLDDHVEGARELLKLKARLDTVPNFAPTRGVGKGRGGASYPLEFRKLVWGELARGTPPSAVPKNTVQAIKATAPWAQVLRIVVVAPIDRPVIVTIVASHNTTGTRAFDRPRAQVPHGGHHHRRALRGMAPRGLREGALSTPCPITPRLTPKRRAGALRRLGRVDQVPDRHRVD